jgi:hypothetical protein
MLNTKPMPLRYMMLPLSRRVVWPEMRRQRALTSFQASYFRPRGLFNLLTMATTRYQSNDLRRQVGSPRPKGRGASRMDPSRTAYDTPLTCYLIENKDTLCRNVLIYGHCRYEDQGCTFSHDQNKNNSDK